jgi:hypothetical protein
MIFDQVVFHLVCFFYSDVQIRGTGQEEDDAEMELALLEMFKLQGDIDPSSLPKTGKV